MTDYWSGVKAAAAFGVLLCAAGLTLTLPVLTIALTMLLLSPWWLLLTVPLAVASFLALGGLTVVLVDTW